MRTCAVLILACAGLLGADDSVETTIKDLYASSQAVLHTARTKDELARVFSTFAPEWVGHTRRAKP